MYVINCPYHLYCAHSCPSTLVALDFHAAVQGDACDECVVDGGAWTVFADADSDALTDAEAGVTGPYLPAAWDASDHPFYTDRWIKRSKI